MEIYKFKCRDCGSTKYVKLNDHTFKCIYCGSIEEIVNSKKQVNKTINQDTKLDLKEKTEHEQNQEDIVIERVPHKNNEQKPNEESRPQSKKARSKLSNATIKFLLCLFLGCFGIHRFVENKFISGFLYMFTAGLFYIGWAFDTIVCLVRLIGEIINYLGDSYYE